jgi:hypothetical protein
MQRLRWLLVAVAVLGSLRADEGYWLFSDPPTKEIADKYHVTLDDAWLKHLSGAAVHVDGASGSFVSSDGLFITNHHMGEDQLHRLSTPEHDYEKNGFYAKTQADELKCEGYTILVLQNTQDVTRRVVAAVKPGMTADEAERAHRAVVAAIEKESFDKTGLHSEVITLFGGARYDLYQYKQYTDVRMVFAPDGQAAFFGGDTDNFEYPRYNLDICFFRIYENGKPISSPDYLAWNSAGPKKDELIFVAGHPGFSQRLVTIDEINYQREVALPGRLKELQDTEAALAAFSASSPEHAREAGESVFSVANSRKAIKGYLAGLNDAELWKAKGEEEEHFRALLLQHPRQKDAVDAYAAIRKATDADRANFKPYECYQNFAPESDLHNIAVLLVRCAAERAKPNGERLEPYRESNLPAIKLLMFAERPPDVDLDVALFAKALDYLVGQMGADDPLVKNLLAGKSSQDRAYELVHNTKLQDVAFRKKIYDGGVKALQDAHDPMLDFVSMMDPVARAARKVDSDDTEIKAQAYEKIYRARVALHQAPPYPDATDTLRLAYGTVSGYEADGKDIPPFTDFAGMYTRAAEHQNAPPFDLPPVWAQDKTKLNLATPFNFCASADILGGNSGSPVVNAKGEFVGIIFDGNEPSLEGEYAYNPANNRCVAVDSAGISVSLRQVYNAPALADELESGHAARVP